MHGGDVQMKHKLSRANNKYDVIGLICNVASDLFSIKNKCFSLAYLRVILLALLTATSIVNAKGIPTQSYDLINTIKGKADYILSMPSDVAVHADKIYIVDGAHHRVVVFDLQGKYLFKFGGKGHKPGEMYYPVGIDAALDKRIYIADSGNHRIQIFSDTGHYISSFQVLKGGTPIRPIDLLHHSRTGHIIVSGANRLFTYKTNGELLSTWGSNGVNEGEFRYPATLAELNDGRIVVVDVLNSRAQVFNMDGSISTIVGEWGVLPGQLFRPKGIAIDHLGNFFISDSYMNVVQKFSDGTQFIAVLGESGKPYDLTTPVGMTIYKNKLYIVEMKKHQISVFQLVD